MGRWEAVRRWLSRVGHWDDALWGERQHEMVALQREQERLRRRQEQQQREAAALERRVRRLKTEVAVLGGDGG